MIIIDDIFTINGMITYLPSNTLTIYTDASGKGDIAVVIDGRLTIHELYSSKKYSSNDLEYIAVKRAVETLPKNSIAVLHSDSQLVINQLLFTHTIHKKRHRQFVRDIHSTMNKNNLIIKFKWVKRRKNKAGKYLG